MIAIMELSQQQLSKQDHYDYGLRSFVIPIARAAGNPLNFAVCKRFLPSANICYLLPVPSLMHVYMLWLVGSVDICKRLTWRQVHECIK